MPEGVVTCPHCAQAVAAAPKRWYNMATPRAGFAEIRIYGDIGMWGITAAQFKQDLEALGAVSDMEIYINSYGGEIFEGYAIMHDLLAHPAKKGVTITGIAASMASAIAMVADPGRLRIYDLGWIMIHDPMVSSDGNARKLRKDADLLDGLKEGIIKAYQRHATQLTKDELWDLMAEESYISAKDAQTYGLVDEVIEGEKVEDPITNTGRISPLNKAGKIVLQVKPNGQQKPATKGVSMIKCPHCGKEHAEGAAFCTACGKPISLSAAHNREVSEAVAAAAVAESDRITGIIARCDKNGLPVDFRDGLIKSKLPLDKAIEKILDEVEKKTPATPVPPQGGVTTDAADKFRDHATKSLGVALNIEKDAAVKADIRKNPGPRDIHGLVRACLAQEGKLTHDQINRLSPQDIAGHAVRMAGMGSSDLPAVLADTMNKEFMGGFDDEPTTYQAVCAEVENPNFMSKSMTKISGFSDIDDLPEGANFKQGKFSDKKETIALSTSGKMLTLSRNLLVNNDTGAIAAVPRAMSGAMRRKMNRDFYDLLTYNTLVGPVTTEDSVAFFNYASHNNLKSSSGVPSVSSLGVADTMLMEQPLPKAEASSATTYLNRTGSILLTGTTNRLTVLQLIGSANDPAATDGKLVKNPYANVVTPVFDAYLQAKLTAASKTYAWYWFAGPNSFRNWVVAFLSGNRTPTLRSEPSRVGEALGISYDIFFDYKFGFEDYRGVIHNDGA
jgi:ATP-dependent protease ClpP protease subunit